MAFFVVSSEQVVYWICPPMSVVRHATTRKPGSLVQGSAIEALGGCEIKVPLATPSDREPRSRQVHVQCPECARAAAEFGHRPVIWDF